MIKAIIKRYIDGAWIENDAEIDYSIQPFMFGSMRSAHHMHIKGDSRRYVLKFYFERRSIEIYAADIEMQLIAAEWANKFNAEDPPKKIEYADAFLVLFHSNGRLIAGCAEEYMSGKFVKYNNNHDYADIRRNTPQAFSHYTWDRSNKKLLICDIQGVCDKYTDPQILTPDKRKFGIANIGMKGINAFINNHRCNTICRSLSLKPMALHKESGYGTPIIEKKGCGIGAILNRKFIFTNIIEGMAAHLGGIKVNDQLISIDDIPIFKHSLKEIKNMLKGKCGTCVKIGYIRTGTLQKVILKRCE